MNGVPSNPHANADDSAGEHVLEEMRRQYDRTWEIKNSLESKGSGIIGVSGTVATLLFGFGTFALQNLNPGYSLLPLFIALLTIGIVTSVTAILLSALLYRVSAHGVPIDPNELEKTDKSKNRTIDLYIKATTKDFDETMINDYLKRIKKNNGNNETKAKLVKGATWIFFSSMISIPLLLIVILYAVSTNDFNFSLIKS
jgi:hypothetical protein